MQIIILPFRTSCKIQDKYFWCSGTCLFCLSLMKYILTFITCLQMIYWDHTAVINMEGAKVNTRMHWVTFTVELTSNPSQVQWADPIQQWPHLDLILTWSWDHTLSAVCGINEVSLFDSKGLIWDGEILSRHALQLDSILFL